MCDSSQRRVCFTCLSFVTPSGKWHAACLWCVKFLYWTAYAHKQHCHCSTDCSRYALFAWCFQRLWISPLMWRNIREQQNVPSEYSDCGSFLHGALIDQRHIRASACLNRATRGSDTSLVPSSWDVTRPGGVSGTSAKNAGVAQYLARWPMTCIEQLLDASGGCGGGSGTCVRQTRLSSAGRNRYDTTRASLRWCPWQLNDSEGSRCDFRSAANELLLDRCGWLRSLNG